MRRSRRGGTKGQRFVADDIEGVFVRALARAERPVDRRLELVLLDRYGGRQSLLRGLDDPPALSWIATHIERALGFAAFPGSPVTPEERARRGHVSISDADARIASRTDARAPLMFAAVVRRHPERLRLWGRATIPQA